MKPRVPSRRAYVKAICGTHQDNYAAVPVRLPAVIPIRLPLAANYHARELALYVQR
jgi:hypothetical protein